ncbi:GntR family transcriptional regulator, partial [Salmonella enterica]|nr:GntR family transcriptional regulator [Salmonella enterica]
MFTLPSSGAIAVYIGMCMEQILTKRRYFDIGLQIEELLYSGVFKAGERLPAERELSE